MRKLSIIFLFILSLSYSPNMYSDYLYGFGNNSFSQMGLKSNVYDLIQLGKDSDWSVVKNGPTHVVAIKKDGSLWGWGSNIRGKLGQAIDRTSAQNWYFKFPVQIGTCKDWTMVECGGEFTIAIKKDGSLWGWGDNNKGELAIDNQPFIDKPTQIGTENSWAKISCYESSIIALKKDGSLWGWGSNYDKKRGGYVTTKPTRIGNANDWKEVSNGTGCAIAIKNDGSLWGWGSNNNGRLGLGEVWYADTPTQIGSDLDWKNISCGVYYSIALKQDGSLWAWGKNRNAQLGLGHNADVNIPTQIGSDLDWKDISCGHNHTLATKKDGSLWGWGSNKFVELSKSFPYQQNTPKQIGTYSKWNSVLCFRSSSIMIDKEGRLWQAGCKVTANYEAFNGVLKKPRLVERYVYARSIQANPHHSFLLTENGNLEASGLNDNKQIPNFHYQGILATSFYRCDEDTKWLTISSNNTRMVGIKDNGTLWECGYNADTKKFKARSRSLEKLTQIGTEDTWQQVACSDYHTVAIKDDGSLWAWGNNKYKQLGIHPTDEFISEPTRVGNDYSWKKVICNNSNTVALKKDGSIWEMGLGLSSYKDRYLPFQMGDQTDWKDISLSREACLAIKNNGTLWAWGRSFYGNGRTNTSITPVQIGTSNDWSKIAAGVFHYLAIKKNGTLWGWGENTNYQLGLSHNTNIYKPTQIGIESGWIDISCSEITSLALKKNEIEIDDNLERLDIKSYPNPAKNDITFSYFLESNMYGDKRIEIYDILGRQVKKIQNLYSREGKNIEKLNIQDLPNGMYYYKFIFSDKTKSGIFYIAK